VENNKLAKPFVKWAGGKGQLIEQYNSRLPKGIDDGKIERYIEPFVGGGAFFFYIAQKFPLIKEFYINDINPDLIFTYKTIKEYPDELILALKHIENDYNSTEEDKKQDFYYSIRERFNKEGKSISNKELNKDWIERATKMIFLNRTCFNGLFRVNSKGEFNVPFGKYKNPKICDEVNILAVNKVLNNNVIILNKDFEDVFEYVNENSFVYFDPPYRPLSITSSFTSYSKLDFNDSQQERLATFYKRLHEDKKAKLMLSNSNSLKDDGSSYFRDSNLYGEDYIYINNVSATRMINSNSDGRGAIDELLITNYLD
jgi:DNA adenine methylase (dam)